MSFGSYKYSGTGRIQPANSKDPSPDTHSFWQCHLHSFARHMEDTVLHAVTQEVTDRNGMIYVYLELCKWTDQVLWFHRALEP